MNKFTALTVLTFVLNSLMLEVLVVFYKTLSTSGFKLHKKNQINNIWISESPQHLKSKN